MGPIKHTAGAPPALCSMCVDCVIVDVTVRSHVVQRKRWDIGVAVLVVMSEKPEFMDPRTGSWDYSWSSVRKEGGRIHGTSGIRSMNRKMSDDVACDLITLEQII